MTLSPDHRGRVAAAAVIALGVLLFGVSLFFDAARYEVVDKSAVEMLLLGWIGPIGLHFGWYANPALLVAWILAVVGGRRAPIAGIVLGVIALFFAASAWVTLETIGMFGRNEGEMAGDLLAYGPAIYLWTASVATGLVSNVVSFALAPRGAAVRAETGS